MKLLRAEQDAWVATASPDGQPCLVPLSFVWESESLLMCTKRTTPTARNLASGTSVIVTLGHTRDVVLIEGTGQLIDAARLPAAAADAFAAKLVWDPRQQTEWIYMRITPRVIKAWREENELAGRVLMRDGAWTARR